MNTSRLSPPRLPADSPAVGVAAGLLLVAFLARQLAFVVGPLLLAAFLMVVLGEFVRRHSRSAAMSSMMTIGLAVAGYAVVAVGAAVVAVSAARFATVLTTRRAAIQQLTADAVGWLEGLGISGQYADSMATSVSPEKLRQAASTVTSSLSSILTNVVFVGALIMFLSIDQRRAQASGPLRVVSGRIDWVRERLGQTLWQYLRVDSICGVLAAGADLAVLIALKVPSAGLWACLAFFSFYVPTLGFVASLVPPLVLAGLDSPVEAAVVLVGYGVIHLLVRVVLQPKLERDKFGTSATLRFCSVVVSTWVLGPLGALLAVPLTLTARQLSSTVVATPPTQPVQQAGPRFVAGFEQLLFGSQPTPPHQQPPLPAVSDPDGKTQP